MTGLYPTKTRRALLLAVNAGDVIEDLEGDIWLIEIPDPPRKVTARITELEDAGWVALSDNDVTWQLTNAGRAVLQGAGR